MRNEKRLIIWSVIGTGISSITVQIVTVREFVTQFHGSEITISLVLFSWLLLTGAGSLIAKYVKSGSVALYSLITLLIALWPLPQILLIRHFREVFLMQEEGRYLKVLISRKHFFSQHHIKRYHQAINH